ncbi:hypothetical protein [Capnocytophaga felis]|uniref:Viral A-type inclusion protein n=1 Tax=Capnocytophaga felis TaxID=2267611 RepID=A0A5M4BAP8_9FLAO|nr:hypothetical protein [Capnocytophaga felis]GET46490.1 hypothetical protein RCZ01_17920 [Capnocytophaga felis]GET48380.1 hypothetical protein RCZ02_12110 [Capnocytophaga felis]
MQDLDPIEIEVAMKVTKAIDDSQNLDGSLKDLDKSVENVKKKFKQKTEELNRNTQAKKTQTQTTRQQTEATQKQTQATKQQNDALTKSTHKFNSLGNSVNQITRELPAFTYSAQTGFMAIANNIPILTDAMAKLRAENEALKASGQKTTPVWKQLIGSLFSWNSLLSVGITLLTVYGDEIGEWLISLFKGGKALDEAKAKIGALNEALRDNSVRKGVQDLLHLEQTLKLTKKGVFSKQEALNQYNDTLGQTVGKLKTYDELEAWMDKHKNRYIQMMLYKSAANKILEKATDELLKKQDISQKTARESASFWDKVIASMTHSAPSGTAGLPSTHNNSDFNAYLKDVDKAGEERKQKELEKAEEQLNEYQKIANEFLAEVKKLEQEMGFKGSKTDSSKLENEYKKLLERIAELDKEYSKQSFDKHDMEVQALKDKFAKVRTLVEEFNKKSKLKIGIDQLNTLEDKAVETLKYRHETENLKKELSKQKELFEEYEAYKTKVGEKEAKERFKNDLKGVESYRKALEEAITKTNADPDSPQKMERLRELQAMLLLANEEQNKRDRNKFADLLEEYKGFNQKRISLETQYNNDISLLEQQRNEANADAVNEAIKMRKAKYEEDLSNLQATILQSSDFYQKLFSDLSQKGYKTLRDFAKYTSEVLNSAKTYNTTNGKTMVRIEYDQINEQGEVVKRVSNITIAEFERIKAKAEELNRILREKNPFSRVVDSFKEIIKSAKESDTDGLTTSLNTLDQSVKMSIGTFKDWGDSLSAVFGDGVRDAMDNISKLTGGVFDLGSGIARIASGDIVGGITSSLSGIGSIYKQLTGWRQKAREQQVKMMLADIEALRTIRQQNLALKENVRELSVYNNQLELRNKLIKDGVIAQDGIQNKFRYDLQMLQEYQKEAESSEKTQKELYNRIAESRFDTGKIKTGSLSSIQVHEMIGGSMEEMKQYYRELIKNGDEAYRPIFEQVLEMLNKSETMGDYFQMLNERGWLHGDVKQFYEQWKKAGEDVEKLQQKFADLKNEMRQVVMGENFDGFVNNFANALAQAQGNVAQFAEFTEEKIKSSLFNAFKYQYLREQLKPLYEQMGDLLNEGVDTLDKDKIEAVSRQFENTFKNTNAKLEQLGKQLGTNLYDNKGAEASRNSLKGAVRGITEQQADLLAGQFGGLRLAQLETNKINKQGFAETMAQTSKMIGIQLEIQHNTKRTADNTEAMKESLKNIETSVKSNKNDLKGNGIKP